MRLLHIFFDVDMRGQHTGLRKVAKGIDIKEGDIVAFVNTKRDRIKVLAGLNEPDSEGVLGYYKSPHGRIDERAFSYIPRAFSGNGFEMKKAIRDALISRGIVEVKGSK